MTYRNLNLHIYLLSIIPDNSVSQLYEIGGRDDTKYFGTHFSILYFYFKILITFTSIFDKITICKLNEKDFSCKQRKVSCKYPKKYNNSGKSENHGLLKMSLNPHLKIVLSWSHLETILQLNPTLIEYI